MDKEKLDKIEKCIEDKTLDEKITKENLKGLKLENYETLEEKIDRASLKDKKNIMR